MSQIVGIPRVIEQQRDIGRAAIFYAVESAESTTPIKWDGDSVLFLRHLGDTEGEVVYTPNETYNNLTAPELMGEAPLKSYRMGSAPVLSIPLVYADPALRGIASSTGSASDGFDRPRPVEERTIVVFCEEFFYNASTKSHDLTLDWSTGAFVLTDPEAQSVPLTGRKLELLNLTLWLWRCHIRTPPFRNKIDDGGKSVETVEVPVMPDITKPNGHLIHTVGNPFTAEIFIDGAS